jgi:hypothetical protein
MFFVVLCSDCILFVDDFTLSKVPSSNGRKFYISSPRSNLSASSARGSVSNLTSVGLEEKQRTGDRLRRLMKDLVVGETKPKYVHFNEHSNIQQKIMEEIIKEWRDEM